MSDQEVVAEYSEEQCEEEKATEPTTEPNNETQLPLFGPGMQRMDKKIAKGKKITRADAVNAMVDTKRIMGAIINDIRQLAMATQTHEAGINHVFAALNCLIELLISKELITKEEFQETWQEKVIKPQEEELERKKAEALEKMKQEGEEVASKEVDEARTMPECRYCGKPDCEFCSTVETQTEDKPQTCDPDSCNCEEGDCCTEQKE